MIARQAADEAFANEGATEPSHVVWTKDEVERRFLAAIERALREVPVPGGMNAEKLAELRHYWDDPIAADKGTAHEEEAHALLNHIDHLCRILQDCSADGMMDQWRAGYEAGVKAERNRRDADAPA